MLVSNFKNRLKSFFITDTVDTKYIWIIGAPRSGTTFLTKLIGLNTDYCFNEPSNIPQYKRNKVAQWEFPKCRSLVFKWCENYQCASDIITKYPNSYFLHCIRDPQNNVFSMAFPKADAWPPRDFPELGEKVDERIHKSMNRWYEYTKGCLKVKDIVPEGRYLPVFYESVIEQLPEIEKTINLTLKKRLEFNNRNLTTDFPETLNSAWEKNRQIAKLENDIKAIKKKYINS